MKIQKVKKLVANLHDKTEYVILVRNLKQALDHGLVLNKIYAWLNPYIDMNRNLRNKKTKT